jgi:hypothetical protein
MKSMTLARRPAKLAKLAVLMLLGSVGCAHKRDVYYPRDNGRGVHVRAPFVDVQVQGKPRDAHSERASRDEKETDRKDKRVSRLPVDREDSDD